MAVQTERVLEILKKELKSKKMKYEDLAERLGMSVSGLKKSLASDDLSVSRLQKICDVLGVPLVEILAAADDEKVQDVYLTEEQETLLLKNAEVFHLYWKLRFENVPLHRYTQSSKARREDVRDRLRLLEKVGLVKINNKGDLEFSDKGMIRWSNYGPLVEHLNRKWSSELIDTILKKKDPRSVLNLALLQLSETSFAEMKEEIRRLLDKYSTQSRKDRIKLEASKIKRVAVLMAAEEHQFVKA
jgi:transcriptional regulator with XRE-family HTH domain